MSGDSWEDASKKARAQERNLQAAIEQTEERHAEATVTASGEVWLTIVCATWAVMVDYLTAVGLNGSAWRVVGSRQGACALQGDSRMMGNLWSAMGGLLQVDQLHSLFRAQVRAADPTCECKGITAFDVFGRPIRVGACPTCDAPFSLLTADEQALAEMRQGATAYLRAQGREMRQGATAYLRAQGREMRQGATAYLRAQGREELLTEMMRQGWTWAEDLQFTSLRNLDLIDEDDLACARAMASGEVESREHFDARGVAEGEERRASDRHAREVEVEIAEQLRRVYPSWRLDHDAKAAEGPKTLEGQGVARIVDEHIVMQRELEHARGERGSKHSIAAIVEGERLVVRNTSIGLRVCPVSAEKVRDAIKRKREEATGKIRAAHLGKSEHLERALVALGSIDRMLDGQACDGRVYEGELCDLLVKLSARLGRSEALHIVPEAHPGTDS